MNGRFIALLLAPFICMAQPCDTAPAHKRYAFVIGNGNYTNLPSPPAAVADSEAVRRALESVDFVVTLVENASMPDLFDKDQKGFLEKVQPGDIAFFYYAGHVVQGPGEDDFLLPVNFDLSESITDAFSLTRFLQDLNKRGPGVTVLMIEGPRPVGRPILGAVGAGLIVPDLREMGRILFAMSAQQGAMVDASPGVAVDLFTKALAQRLQIPGLTLTEVFEKARQDVIDETKQHQLPRVDPISSGGFCFLPPVTKVETPAPAEPVKPVVLVETVPNNRRDHEEYVRIPPGTFKMGCVPRDSKCKADEKPQHEVTLTNGFWMGRNEVEVRAFLKFWRETAKKKTAPRQAPTDYRGWIRDNLPMVRVTWEEARDYCQWAGGRLSTEAEWEYAARAGATDEIYPMNSENSRDKANFAGTQGNDTFLGVAPVRSFDPNGFNLYDMLGNVWEWVWDFYDPSYYQKSPAVDPKGPEAGKEHIVRGGSFESDWHEHLRLSFRLAQAGENFKTGFRCALDDTPATRQLLGVP
ncbi:MAG: SUMF1/EgtB/PvdO family nonheme iron enzyme [Bryobacteraceae bacterium]